MTRPMGALLEKKRGCDKWGDTWKAGRVIHVCAGLGEGGGGEREKDTDRQTGRQREARER